MANQLALKRLTRSDLTFFEPKYRTIAAGNQKAINLNADVFIRVFYPSAPDIAATIDNEIRIALSIFGPEGKPEDRMTRKIIRDPSSYKNWRLNGEFVRNPEDDDARYDALQPGDIAVMLFEGEPVPTALKLCLISQTGADAAIHQQLQGLFGNRSMAAITPAALAQALQQATTPPAHPINAFADDPIIEAALEDAALGGEVGVRTVLQRRAGRRISAEDLAKARANADRIGRDGEGLIDAFLREQRAAGQITSSDWVSSYNAVSPFDFRITFPSSQVVKLDVKSTKGPFDNNFHISVSELIEAAQAPERYDIYRVFDLNEDGGKLRIARDIRAFAKSVIDALAALPAGIRCDSFSVPVSVAGLTWDTELAVSWPDAEEEAA